MVRLCDPVSFFRLQLPDYTLETIAFVALLVSGFLFIGAVCGIIAFSKVRRLEKRFAHLQAHFDEIGLQKQNKADAATSSGQDAGEVKPSKTHTPGEMGERSGRPTASIPEEYAQNPSAEPAPEKAKPRFSIKGFRSFEERIGARWAVWLGGLAMVLGGVFMVRYSIDAGLLTPLARVIAGALTAAALVGGGEWTRRRSAFESREKQAYIPGVLTLAGTTTAFASVFAAHALYNLIGPSVSFVLLALTALVTLIAATLHGPAVASYGLLASYFVPFLVNSDNRSLWPLAIYGVFVSVAAYGVARLRLWRWLAIGAAIGAILWGHLLAIGGNGAHDVVALAFYNLAALGLATFVFVFSLYARNPSFLPSSQDRAATTILILHGALFFYLLQVDAFGPLSLVLFTLFAATLLIIAAQWPSVSYIAFGAASLLSLGYFSWDVSVSPADALQQFSSAPRMMAAWSDPSVGEFLKVGVLFAVVAAAVGFWGALVSSGRMALSVAGAATPVALLIIAYLRVSSFDGNTFFGLAALGLAVGLIAGLRRLELKLLKKAHGREAALAVYAIGSVAAIIFAMSILLENGWLPVGLALLSVGIIWVREKWPVPSLAWTALIVALLSCAVIAYEPTIVGTAQLSKTPLFNPLLYGYGVPAISFAFCAWRLRFGDALLAQRIFESLALFAGLVTIMVLIHHAMNDGAFYAPADTLAERSLFSLVLLSGALVFQRLDHLSHSPVLRVGSLIAGATGFAAITTLHLFILNPFLTGENIGDGLVFNLLLTAYLLPAIICAAIALGIGGRYLGASPRPVWYRVFAGGLSGALLFFWITLEVRAFFHGGHLSLGATGETELYSYSAAWLAFGVIVLLLGFKRNSRILRLASAVFVFAAVVKVFLFDMNGLDGPLRALSFIGLGAALIGIGYLYQRLLARRSTSAGADDL